MKQIARLINLIVSDFENKKQEIQNGVKTICEKYKLY